MLELIASFLIALLMGIGVGGGGLFIIYLTLCLSYPQILAQGTNLLFFSIASAFSLFIHSRRRKIDSLYLSLMIVFGVCGSVLFSNLANFISPIYPKKVLGALLVISGAITLYNCLLKNLFKKFKKTLYK